MFVTKIVQKLCKNLAEILQKAYINLAGNLHEIDDFRAKVDNKAQWLILFNALYINKNQYVI